MATEVRGLDVLIKIGSQVVGGQRNASLELSAESIDATCKTTGGWSNLVYPGYSEPTLSERKGNNDSGN